MFKLMGLLLGLAALAATPTTPPRDAASTLSSVAGPPAYATRDALGALALARP